MRKTMTTVMMALTMAGAAGTMRAGAFDGSKSAVTSVNANARDTFRPIVFRGGELASVMLKGDGDTDLDLYIYDEAGTLVAKDDDGMDLCIARWRPRWTGSYTIVVRNRGTVYNRYVMVTN
jgi:hypothetical protein